MKGLNIRSLLAAVMALTTGLPGGLTGPAHRIRNPHRFRNPVGAGSASRQARLENRR
jgi:hypothetical protein